MGRARTKPPLVIAFALSGMLFLLWQGWVSIRNGLSDIYARPAITYLEEIIVTDSPISEPQWQAVYDGVSSAAELMPANPRYLGNLGWLEQIRLSVLADAHDTEQLSTHSLAAETYFRGALAARPTWAHYWGSVALENHRRGDVDTSEYSEALINAVRFGPWIKGIQQLVADLGSDTLQALSPAAQRAYFLNLERGLKSQPETMLGMVRDWGNVCDSAQSLDPSMPLLSDYCNGTRDPFMP